MSQKKKARFLLRRIKIPTPIPGKIVSSQPKNKLVSFKITVWKLIVGLGVLTGIVVSYFNIITETRSQHKKYQDANFNEGELRGPFVTTDTDILKIDTVKELKLQRLISPGVEDSMQINAINPIHDTVPKINGVLVRNFNSLDSISIFIGNMTVNVKKEKFIIGFSLFDEGILDNLIKGMCTPFNLRFGVKNNRIFVSTEFRDLKKEETIGIINYNKWQLYLPNMLDYSDSDTSLLVKDKQNYVAFSIMYDEAESTIYVKGYLLNSSSCLIMPDPTEQYIDHTLRCISKKSKDWKKQAEGFIDKISRYNTKPLSKDFTPGGVLNN